VYAYNPVFRDRAGVPILRSTLPVRASRDRSGVAQATSPNLRDSRCPAAPCGAVCRGRLLRRPTPSRQAIISNLAAVRNLAVSWAGAGFCWRLARVHSAIPASRFSLLRGAQSASSAGAGLYAGPPPTVKRIDEPIRRPRRTPRFPANLGHQGETRRPAGARACPRGASGRASGTSRGSSPFVRVPEAGPPGSAGAPGWPDRGARGEVAPARDDRRGCAASRLGVTLR
jgi:hypothetical protein